jgi:hypothetical protein
MAASNPPGPRGVRIVDRWEEFVATPFADGVHAVCWRRTLAGDFGALAAALAPHGAVAELDEELLRTLPEDTAVRAAAQAVGEDLRRLRTLGHDPAVECMHAYARDDDQDGLSTDVYSWHVDTATVPTETILCSYTSPATEGLPVDQAVRRIELPGVRATLLARWGGADDAGFEAYLRETFQALHYVARAGAAPFSFGVGNLWRIAVAHPASTVPACIHRAPADRSDGLPRLLLIS